MGAYLYFKVNKSSAEKFNIFVSSLEENKKLMNLSRAVLVYSSEDIAWAKENNQDPQYFIDRIGKGDWKASGISTDETEKLDEDIYEIVAKIFEKAQKKYKMKIYSGSCALSGDYFNKNQIKRITKNGERLSSTPLENKENILKLLQ